MTTTARSLSISTSSTCSGRRSILTLATAILSRIVRCLSVSPENCLDDDVDSKARAILVWREDEKQLPAAAKRLRIGVVKSVGECLDILTQVDSAAGDEPGVVDRIPQTNAPHSTNSGSPRPVC